MKDISLTRGDAADSPLSPLPYTTVLVIAGSDPIAGAGLQADIKACLAMGVYAMTVVTAVTAQNTCGVRAFRPVGPDMLRAQLDAVLDDVTPGAIKIGMLPDVESIRIVADTIAALKPANVVLDPVLVATSGHALTAGGTVEAMRSLLAPLCTVITPNLPETEALTGLVPTDAAGLAEAAATLVSAPGPRCALIKGGHGIEDEEGNLTDYFRDRDGREAFIRHPRIETPNTHGTGCSLSSALAARLALGDDPLSAATAACRWLAEAISAGARWRLGKGHGPVCHLPAPHTFLTPDHLPDYTNTK